jgi:hypothetical protein
MAAAGSAAGRLDRTALVAGLRGARVTGRGRLTGTREAGDLAAALGDSCGTQPAAPPSDFEQAYRFDVTIGPEDPDLVCVSTGLGGDRESHQTG